MKQTKTQQEIETSKKTRTAKATATKKKSQKGTSYTKKEPGSGTFEKINVIDDWGEDGDSLSDKDKIFIQAYTSIRTPSWHNKSESARISGSKANRQNIHSSGDAMYKRLKKTIDYIEKNQKDKLLTKQNELNFNSIITRCNFDINDFYENVTFEDRNGNFINTFQPKKLEDLTPEQRNCIDGIEFDKFGRPNFKLANREKAIDRIDRLIDALGDNSKGDKYDVSLTVEGIRNKLETKISIIQKHSNQTSEASGIDGATDDEEL